MRKSASNRIERRLAATAALRAPAGESAPPTAFRRMGNGPLLGCCLAAFLIGAAITGGISRGAQVSSGTTKDKGAGPAGDKAAADKPGPNRSNSIEIGKCLIRLVDEVTLAFDRPGILSFIELREGDSVREGQLIAGLADEVAQATLAIAAREAESDVDIRYSEKAGQVAEAEHQKAVFTNQLWKTTVPEVEVLRLKLAWEKTLLEAEAARHRKTINGLKRDEAQAQLDTYRIKAPFAGIVTRVHRSKGEPVRQGDQVLEVVNTKRVRIEGLVDIRDIWHVKPGLPVQVRLDIPGVELEVEKQSFTGRIVFVDVKAEPVSHAVRIWAEVDNPDNVLRAGLQARMTIFPDRQAPAN